MEWQWEWKGTDESERAGPRRASIQAGCRFVAMVTLNVGSQLASQAYGLFIHHSCELRVASRASGNSRRGASTSSPAAVVNGVRLGANFIRDRRATPPFGAAAAVAFNEQHWRGARSRAPRWLFFELFGGFVLRPPNT